MSSPLDSNACKDHPYGLNDVRRKELSIPESMRILSDEKGLSTVISTGLTLPQLSPDTAERVFPIRSVVSVDSNPSSALQTPSLEISESKASPFGEGPWTFPVTSGKPWSQPTLSPTKESCCESLSSDFVPKDRPIFLTGSDRKPSDTLLRMSKDGDQSSIASGKCTSEPWQSNRGQPFHTLNQVQSFGALIVLQECRGRLAVQVTSKNSKDIVGYTPRELFDLDCFCDILRHDQRDDFLYHARFVRDEDRNVEQHGPDVLILFISTPNLKTKSFWCTMHASNENMDYIICELEPEEDSMSIFTLVGHAESDGDNDGNSGLSPKKATRPLRALRMFRERKGEFDLTNILNAMSRVLQLAWNAQTLDALLNGVIEVIRELIGFSRVAVYQFDSDWNSLGLADSVDPEMAHKSYQDMTPLSSISADELRRLHLLNKVCTLYSHNQPSADLIYRDSETEIAGVDMTHCYLLSTSSEFVSTPAHTYMSIGIYVFGNLWGLISCQAFEQDMRLLPPIHKLCWLISNTISSNIERLSYTLPFNIQEHSSTAEVKVYKCDTAPAGDIVSLFGADYGVSLIFDETKILGKPSDSQEVLAVVEYLKSRKLNRILWSTEITKDFQDLNYPPGFKHISGLLYIPLSADSRDFIIFFRASQWSDPIPTRNEDVSNYGLSANLNPDGKGSYYRPHAWSAVDLGKAYMLSVVYRTFIQVWQQKEAALQSTQLMRLLLANSAHEFRTPLNAIINYLEIALDGSLSQETRDNLSRSHSASRSLIYIINDLLDLTNAENGQNLIKDEIFNLSETLNEAIDIFWEEAKQKHVKLHLLQHSRLPRVLGDQRRVRQVITNLISNAVQHTSSGAVTVESCILPDKSEPNKIGIEVAIHDTGAGMSEETVEALFCELEQVSNEDYIRNSCMDSSGNETEESKNVLGLGLALVARIVRNMDGQLSVKSEKGKGSCFKIRLRFPLPSTELEGVYVQNTDLKEASRLDEGDKQTDREYDSDRICTSQNSTEQDRQSDSTDLPASGDERRHSNDSCGKDLFPTANYDTGISVTTDASHLNHFSKTGSSNRGFPSLTRPRLVSMLSWPPQQEREADAARPLNASREEQPKCDDACQPGKTSKQGQSEVTDRNTPVDAKSVSTKENSANQISKSADTSLHVLVAEDDPINSTILRKRLEKSGHTVHMTGNGKECASVYRENHQFFDAILMDIQMPIVDGITSTRMIREFEQSTDSISPSNRDSNIRRTPIFAVSASLLEKDRQAYIDSGFDGWIMKPIDFHRVNLLLKGTQKEDIRSSCTYESGMWEKGGWFE
ncbi:hypothetical protein PHISCL_01749 [Aspergillus sclerotialis]|uniref:Uncharacterized protein n=1 Tax=Aspergillus sclerotialis TaxID=2070753 RepID=A0A3A2ZX00_9EURO|nr:hypothetical protein PHISCL_01749 [Aspergillus sclerotialis]